MKRHLLRVVGLMVGLGLLALRVAAQQRAGEAGKEEAPNAGVKGVLKLKSQMSLKPAALRSLPGVDSLGNPAPRVVVYPGSLEFLDEAGNVSKKVAPPSGNRMDVHPSKGNEVIGIQFTRGHNHEKGGWTSGEYIVLAQSGRQTLHIKNFNHQFLPVPAPTGDYIVGWPAQDTRGGPPEFYDARGLRNEWTRNDDAGRWPKGYTVNELTFTADGHFSAARASKGISAITVFFDARGELLWTFAGEGALVFGPSNNWVAITDHNGTHIFDLRGEKIRDLAVPGDVNSYSRVSDDGEFMLLVNANGIASRFNTQTGAISWQKNILPTPTQGVKRKILSLDSTADLKSFVLLTLSTKMVDVRTSDGSLNLMPQHVDASVLLLDSNAELLDTVPISPAEIVNLAPIAGLKISNDGKTLHIPGKTLARIYSRQ